MNGQPFPLEPQITAVTPENIEKFQAVIEQFLSDIQYSTVKQGMYLEDIWSQQDGDRAMARMDFGQTDFPGNSPS